MYPDPGSNQDPNAQAPAEQAGQQDGLQGITFEYDPNVEDDQQASGGYGFDPTYGTGLEPDLSQAPEPDPYEIVAQLARSGQLEAAQAALEKLRGTAAPARQPAFQNPFEDPAVMAELDELEMTNRQAYRQRFAELASLAAANRVLPTAQGSANASLVQMRMERELPQRFGRAWNNEVQRTVSEAFNRLANENPHILSNPQEALRILEEVGNAKVGEIVRRGNARPQPPVGARVARGPASYVANNQQGQSRPGVNGTRVVRVTAQDVAAAEKFGISAEQYAARRSTIGQQGRRR